MRMKEKLSKLINSIVDVRKLVLRTFIVLWAVLILALITKYTMGMWYPIVIDIEWIVKVSNFIDSNVILNYATRFILYILSLNIWFLSATALKKYPNKKMLISINLMIILSFVIKSFSNLLGCIAELPYLIGIPIYLNVKNKTFVKPKRKWLNVGLPIIIYLLFNLWQMNIMIVRDCNKILSLLPTMIIYAIQTDYYAILLNTWIGVSYMGLVSGGWFFASDLVGLKAQLQKELAKETPDKEYVKELEKRIKGFEETSNK